MSDRIEKAVTNYNNGYNCAQAVICAYSDVLGIDEVLAYKLSEGFGGGMGGLKETCGAVSAMFMALSYLNSDGKLENGKSKGENYKIIREAAAKFKEQYGALECRNIKRGEGRVCADKVRAAAEILDELIING